MSDKPDRQTQAVAEAYLEYCLERTIRAKPQNPYKEMFEAGWKAAIAASDAKYVPMLVEALKFYAEIDNEIEKMRLGFAAKQNTKCEASVAGKTLAQLPEDLR